jgi:hypothetical protein
MTLSSTLPETIPEIIDAYLSVEKKPANIRPRLHHACRSHSISRGVDATLHSRFPVIRFQVAFRMIGKGGGVHTTTTEQSGDGVEERKRVHHLSDSLFCKEHA